jgi:hypothetical protein
MQMLIPTDSIVLQHYAPDLRMCCTNLSQDTYQNKPVGRKYIVAIAPAKRQRYACPTQASGFHTQPPLMSSFCMFFTSSSPFIVPSSSHSSSPPRPSSHPPHSPALRIFPYKCIGAKLRILLHCFPLNSCATTPLNRLPIGSPPLLIKTQALSSNLTTLPSGREYFFAVRTITACRMSPRRTLLAALTETLPPGPDSGPKFRCFCTTTTMRSPEEEEEG